jgi:hypothetical protein
MNNSTYRINENYRQQISLMTSPFEQYARAYLLIYEHDKLFSQKSLSILTKVYQKVLLDNVDTQNIISIIASSSNVISNALRTLNSSHKSIMLSNIRHMLKEILQPMSMHVRAKL